MTTTRENGISLTPAKRIPERLGLALGGGFARGIAHVGVLRVLEENHVPLHCIAGVSAGAIVASAYASGTGVDDIARTAMSMRMADVSRWSIGRLGFAVSERMTNFLRKLLQRFRFEDMPLPLGVVATDLQTGEPANFRDAGDVCLAVRASCSYPGLFQPVRDGNRLLVDGAMSTGVPAQLCRDLGATRVISVNLPMQLCTAVPRNVFQVLNRCFQIMQVHEEQCWRRVSDVVLTPGATSIDWDGFASASQLIEAGANAAKEALPEILSWVEKEQPVAA